MAYCLYLAESNDQRTFNSDYKILAMKYCNKNTSIVHFIQTILFISLSGCAIHNPNTNNPNAELITEIQELRNELRTDRERLTTLEEELSSVTEEMRIFVTNEAGLAFRPQDVRPQLRDIDTSTLPALGEEDSLIGIIEFTDYQCPYCKLHHESTYEEIKSNYVANSDVKYFVSDFPLANHIAAKSAALAAYCASMQGKFWEYHDLLFEYSPGLNENVLIDIASSLQLELPQFAECIDSPVSESQLEFQLAIATELGIVGTPSFVIGELDNQGIIRNGILVQGHQPFDDFAGVIERVKEETFR